MFQNRRIHANLSAIESTAIEPDMNGTHYVPIERFSVLKLTTCMRYSIPTTLLPLG